MKLSVWLWGQQQSHVPRSTLSIHWVHLVSGCSGLRVIRRLNHPEYDKLNLSIKKEEAMNVLLAGCWVQAKLRILGQGWSVRGRRLNRNKWGSQEQTGCDTSMCTHANVLVQGPDWSFADAQIQIHPGRSRAGAVVGGGGEVEPATMFMQSSISTSWFIRSQVIGQTGLGHSLHPHLPFQGGCSQLRIRPDKLFIKNMNPFHIWWRIPLLKFSERYQLWFPVSEVSLTSWNLFTSARLWMK